MESKSKEDIIRQKTEHFTEKYKTRSVTDEEFAEFISSNEGEMFIEAMQEFSDQQNTTLIEQNRKLWDALDEARAQIEYLENKFRKTGTGNAVLSRIEQTLKDTEDGK